MKNEFNAIAFVGLMFGALCVGQWADKAEAKTTPERMPFDITKENNIAVLPEKTIIPERKKITAKNRMNSKAHKNFFK